MQATTLKNRLAKLEIAKNSIAYKVIVDLVENTNKSYKVFPAGIIRPVHTSGSGRFISNQDHSRDISNLLDKLKVKYSEGNDAPRGGATGKYLKIITKIEY